MATPDIAETDGTTPNPALLGSLAYLVLNLPVGIAGFVLVVTMVSVGVSTAIIWVGVPVLALAVLVWRTAAQLERRRVLAMLGTYVATPYRPLPDGMTERWRTRLGEAATWKDMTYFLLMLPIGTIEFSLMVSFWSVSLWLLLLPLSFGFLPADWYPTFWGHLHGMVDSTWATLPFAAIGALLLAVTVAMTRGLGALHARFARAMLGPSRRRLDAMAIPAPVTPGRWDFRANLHPSV